jgi:hypothetical protein
VAGSSSTTTTTAARHLRLGKLGKRRRPISICRGAEPSRGEEGSASGGRRRLASTGTELRPLSRPCSAPETMARRGELQEHLQPCFAPLTLHIRTCASQPYTSASTRLIRRQAEMLADKTCLHAYRSKLLSHAYARI